MKKRTWLIGALTTFTLSIGLDVKAEELDQEIREQTGIINQLNQQKAVSTAELTNLTAEMNTLQAQVATLQKKKIAGEKAVSQLNNKILDLQEKINQRQLKINQQARHRQVNGRNQNMIAVIFGSDNIEEVITRSMAYAKIVQINQQTMDEQKADKQAVAYKKMELDQQIRTIQTTTEKLAKQTDQLAAKKKDQEVMIYSLGSKIEKEEATKKKYQVKQAAIIKEREELARLAREKAAAEQKAAADAQAKAAAQQKAIQAAQAEAAKNVGQTTNKQVASGTTAQAENSQPSSAEVTPTGTNGFSAPLPSLSVTSGYGSRNDPTGSSGTFHSGIDFAGYANQPIQAAGSGTVVASGYEPGGGNHVIIKHPNGYYTYYLHLNQRLAQVGQAVTTGQTIGLMGSTGNSTGVHLHFGVSTGFWSGYQNPAPFLGI